MPGFIVHQQATVQCSHGGPAQPSMVSQRVTVSGNPVSLMPHIYTISGCGLIPTGSPCVTGTWTMAAQRVFIEGMATVLFDSQSVCTANGTPLVILQTQTRAKAS
jgi:hypothetical protein